jgi:hypothetical protein
MRQSDSTNQFIPYRQTYSKNYQVREQMVFEDEKIPDDWRI